MTRRPARLPHLAAWLVALVPLGERRTEVEADFAELFDARARGRGTGYAWRRLLVDVLSLPRPIRGGSVLQDMRFGLRLYRRHPAAVGVTVGGLALAIGVVTSVFSIVNASILRPYDIDDPSSVVDVMSPIGHGAMSIWPYGQFLQFGDARLATAEASLQEKVRFGPTPAADDTPVQRIRFVSGGYLSMLGGRAALGRSLEPSDHLEGAPPVVVVSHVFWTTRLDADRSVIGRTIWLNGAPLTVVGVARPGFTGPLEMPPAFWTPFATYDGVFRAPAFTADSKTIVEVVARLAPGVSLAAAQDEFTAVASRLPGHGSKANVRLYPAGSPIDGPDSGETYLAITLILAIVGLVLALACANAANLLLAGAVTRVREIGVRLALGATSRRLVRQLVSESLALGLVAGGLGLVFAMWFVPILGSLISMPPDVEASPDWSVLAFAIGTSLVCGLGAGLAPARFGARGDLLAALKSQGAQSGTAPRTSRLRTAFVGFQAAVSMLLLVAAALFTRSALHLTRTDVGLEVEKLLSVDQSYPRTAFNAPAYLEAALAAVAAVPSVEAVSITSYLPFGGSVELERFTHDGRSYALYGSRTDADYFRTTGLRIVRGRAFTPAEVASSAAVVLVSESVVRDFFKGADPIGRRLSSIRGERDQNADPTIIGVVADAVAARVRSQAHGSIYRPLDRNQPSSNPLDMIVRASNPAAAARGVEDALRRLDPRVRVTTSVVKEDLEAFLGTGTMLALLAAPIAGMALALAVLGIYGVTAFVVSQRTQEVSVRLAIGASAHDILHLLVRQSLRPVVIGLSVGLVAALAAGRVISSELAGISPHDPVAIAAAVTLLLSGALMAVIGPARRAARTDPAAILRY